MKQYYIEKFDYENFFHAWIWVFFSTIIVILTFSAGLLFFSNISSYLIKQNSIIFIFVISGIISIGLVFLIENKINLTYKKVVKLHELKELK